MIKNIPDVEKIPFASVKRFSAVGEVLSMLVGFAPVLGDLLLRPETVPIEKSFLDRNPNSTLPFFLTDFVYRSYKQSFFCTHNF